MLKVEDKLKLLAKNNKADKIAFIIDSEKAKSGLVVASLKAKRNG